MQAKETRYKNIVFRSRLEARWAVFFDTLGLIWDYEPEGYVLNNGASYLPDFFVHDVKGHVGNSRNGIYVEVKGELTSYDKQKISGFEYPIFVVGNIPDSTNVWKDVYRIHGEAEEYMYSENTFDHVMNPLWFARGSKGISLLRRSESVAKGFINWCEDACERARNYKFEFVDEGGSTNGNHNSSNRNAGNSGQSYQQSYGSFNDLYSQMMDGLFKAFDPQEMQKREAERKRKQNEFAASIPKVTVRRVREIFVSMPGISEYGLTERIVDSCGKQIIPAESTYSVSFDRAGKRLIIKYSYSTYKDFGSFSDSGELFSIYLTVNENSTPTTEAQEYDRLSHIVNNFMDLFKEEMTYETRKDENAYAVYLRNKERRRDVIKDAINKEKIEEREYAEFQERNNPYVAGVFYDRIKEEINENADNLKYKDELLKIHLAAGIKKDERFGYDDLSVQRYGCECVYIKQRHNCQMEGKYGKRYRLNVSRSFFEINVQADKELSHMQSVERITGIVSELNTILNNVKAKMKENETNSIQAASLRL